MSDGLNRVILIGRLGQDPEVRQTNGGSVMNLSLACTESWFDKRSNQRQERVEWLPVVLFGARAEGLARCLAKGDQVAVEGSLRTEKWQDKQTGATRTALKIYASNVVLCGGGKGGGGQRAPHPDDDGRGQGEDDDIQF